MLHRVQQSGLCELTASRNFPYDEWDLCLKWFIFRESVESEILKDAEKRDF
jgi:hypothetical protein